MKFPVIAHANATTGILTNERTHTDKNGKEITNVHMMVQQNVMVAFGNRIDTVLRTAWTSISMPVFNLLEDEIIDGQPFPVQGKIIVKETHVPYIIGKGTDKERTQECKQYPNGHPRAGEAVLSGGKRVYRNVIFSALLNGTYVHGSEDVLLPTDKPGAPAVSNKSPEDAFLATMESNETPE